MAQAEIVSNSGLLKIGDIARITGLTLRTLRYYEEMSLIEPEQRSKGNFRLYSQDVLNKLRFIDSLKRLDFTLEEIKTLLGPTSDNISDKEIVDRTLKALQVKQERIKSRMNELLEMKTDVESSLHLLEECVTCQFESNNAPCDIDCENKAYHLH